MQSDDFLLKMHYYPPHHREQGVPVDTFFFHVIPAYGLEMDSLRDAMEALIEACVDKYHLVPRKKTFQRATVWDVQDVMWEAVPRP